MPTTNSPSMRRIGYIIPGQEIDEDVAASEPPPMLRQQVGTSEDAEIKVPITEAHKETRDRIDVMREFIASDAFQGLNERQRLLKVRELEWLAKVDAQLNASYDGAQVEPKD